MWTHLYDFLLKALSLLLAILIFTNIPRHEDYFLLFITGLCLLPLVIYYYIFRTFSSYLYARLTLGMPINLRQASALNPAFSPWSPISKWLPMKDLRKIDKDLRYEAALSALKQWQEEKRQSREQRKQDFRNSKLKTKALLALMCLIIAYFGVASFLNLPPVSYFSNFVASLLPTDGYYPMFSFVVFACVTILIFRMLDKDIVNLDRED